MDYEETKLLLERHGWTLECWSPLEISEDDTDGSSRASGRAAQIVIDAIISGATDEEVN